MKSLIFFLFISFNLFASHFQITLDKGYFKNGYSLADTKFKNDSIYLLSHISNKQVGKQIVLTKATFEKMKRDFIQIASALKAANQRKIATCESSVTLKAQGKEKSFCTSGLTESESKDLNAWLDKARLYSGFKTN